MNVLADLVGVTITHTGTGGPIPLGSAALVEHRTFAAANAAGQLPNGSVVSYTLYNNDQAETCRGLYNSVANTLTRTTISSTTGSALNLSGDTVLVLAANSADLIGDNIRLPPRSGNWFGEFTSFDQGAMSANQILYVPLICSVPTVIDRLAMFVAAAVAGGLVKVGLFRPHSTTRLPDARIAECATDLDASTTGRKDATFSANPTVPAGLSYMGIAFNNSTIQSRIVTAGHLPSFCLQNSIDIGIGNAEMNVLSIGQTLTYVSGSPFFPANATPTVTIFGQTPIVLARAL
jgi:hypothetical protein